jgi:hypothetical protein
MYPKRRTRIQTLMPTDAAVRKSPKRKTTRGPIPGRNKSNPKARALKIESNKKTKKDRITPISQDPRTN